MSYVDTVSTSSNADIVTTEIWIGKGLEIRNARVMY